MQTVSLKIKKNFFDKENLPLYFLAFLFPFLTMLLVFVMADIFPFGKRMILTVDCYHQYVPFLVEFRNKLISGRSFFYSWNSGLGTEYYAAMANYAASPLNVLSIFFNAKTMPIFAMLITAIRSGLASLFMSFFLKAHDNRRKIDFVIVVFSCFYALCGWFLTDFWNLMWCDALVLLPLIVLGLHRLFKYGKYGIYVIFLALALLSNYYTGYFICVFLCIFAPVYYVAEFFDNHVKKVRNLLLNAGRFIIASIFGGLIPSIVLIPTYMILQKCSATSSKMEWNFALENKLFDFLGRFMLVATPNIRDGMANVYTGIIVVLLVILFFMANPKTGINLRKKICYGLLLIVMYLSFTNRTLNYIWHGFHFPNQIPYRESFLISFILVIIGYKTIRILRSYTLKQITIVGGAVIGYLFLFEKIGEGNESYLQYFVTLVFVVIQLLVLRAIKINRRKSSFFYEILLMITCFMELITATAITIISVGINEGFPSYDFYGKNQKIIQEYCAEIEGTEGHKNFERSEIYPHNICAMQSLYDVKGLSIFSSTTRESFVKYMSKFGFHNNGINSVRNNGLTHVTATLLGIRNFVTVEDTKNVPLIFEKEKEIASGVNVYKNEDALALGYVVNDDLLDYFPDNKSPFVNINSWVEKMCGVEDCFEKISLSNCEVNGATLTGENDAGLTYKFSSDKSSATFLVSGARKGEEVYVYVPGSEEGTLKILGENDGNEVENTINLRSNQIVSLGVYDGNPIKAQLSYSKEGKGSVSLTAYQLNNKKYSKMVQTLSKEQLNVTSYSDNEVTGNISLDDDGLLFLTIPYSEGWEVKIDGKEDEICSVGEAFCAVRLSSGEHEVKLKYMPPRFKMGLIITITASSFFVIFLIAKNLFLRVLIRKKQEVLT